MTSPDAPLADGFAPATREAWRALAETTLKGAAPETLESRTADGLVIEPLYARFIPGAPDVRVRVRTGEGGWDIRSPVRHPDPRAANRQALEAIAGGSHSLALAIDPDGRSGIAIGSSADLGTVLADVSMEQTPVVIDAGFLGPIAGQWLAGLAKASPRAALGFGFDPLSALARRGASPGPIEAHVRAAASLATDLCETFPECSLFAASGVCVHEAGGTDGEELAFAAAAALAYAQALVESGLSMKQAWRRITLRLALEPDAFASIIKLRAARRIRDQMASACEADAPAQIEVHSSERMLTRAEPWTNLVRLTAVCFAAAVGGADAVVLGAFTDAIGHPTAFARRMARNTQLILMQESGLGRVADPAAGSGYVEAASEDLAAAAWRRFQAIEAAGGAASALASGLVQRWVLEGRATLTWRLAEGEMRIVGVTDFSNPAPATVEVDTPAITAVRSPDPRLDGPDSLCPALEAIRCEDLAP